MPDPDFILGFIEVFGGETLAGWAFRPGDDSPASLSLCIDGNIHGRIVCDLVRLDVAAAREDIDTHSGRAGQLGFVVDLPTAYFDGAEHEIQLLGDDSLPVELITVGAGPRESWTFSAPAEKVLGQVDPPIGDGTIHGWLVVHNRITGEKTGCNLVRVTSNSVTLAEMTADVYRPDVASVFGCNPQCGFIFVPFQELSDSAGAEFCFSAIPYGVELLGSPVTILSKPRSPQSIASQQVEAHGAVVQPTFREGAAPLPDTASGSKVLTSRFPIESVFGIGTRLAELRKQLVAASSEDAPTRIYQSDAEQLIASELDYKFYLSANKDVKEAGIDPVIHYTYTGYKEGRAPTRWFDPGYYLLANPDVRDAGINPFWHYLVTGREEGRLPSKFGGFRRDIIDNLVPPDQKTRGYFRATSIPKLLLSKLKSTFAKVLAQAEGLVLSISHDCYVRATGGVQLFIADEQAGFARRRLAYLNLSPVHPDLVLAEPTSHGMLQLVLDGKCIGITTPEELAAVITELSPQIGDHRIFIVHCLLGHQPEQIASLQSAFRSEQNFFWLHDFSSVCEGFNLLRNDVAFCGAPPPGSLCCRVCIYGDRRARHLARIRRFFVQVPLIVVAPSRSARDIWLRATSFPYVALTVHEHCHLDESSMRISLVDEGPPGSPDNPVRIAFVGTPAVHKGWPLFVDLVNRAAHLNCYSFYHFTSSEDSPAIVGVERVIARTTPDDRDAMVNALAAHGIDIVLILSPWPETFSYVAFEALAAGADIVTTADSGNVADIVLSKGRGLVFQEDEGLYELFESLRIVHYVGLCYQQGMIAGRLIHDGTTATINLAENAAWVA